MPKELKKNQNDDSDSGDLQEGDEVFVSFGGEKFGPVQYHNFDVGPFTAKTTVREGETGLQAMQRAYRVCRAAARASYPEKRDDFLANVHDAAEAAHQRARR